MNPNTTTSQARMRPRDMHGNQRANSYLAGAALPTLERRHGWQAEAEIEWLLKQNGVTSRARVPVVSMLRQAIGAALMRSGERLAGTSANRVLPGMVRGAGSPGSVGSAVPQS